MRGGCISIGIFVFCVGGIGSQFEQGNILGVLIFLGVAAATGIFAFLTKPSIPEEDREEVNGSLRIINESVAIIERSKNWETMKSRIGVIIQIYEGLLARFGKYSEADDYRKNLALAKEEQKTIHLKAVKIPVQQSLKKARDAATVTAKVNACVKALGIIDEASGDPLVSRDMLAELRETVKLAQSQFEMEADLSKAAKHEFKGQTDKAIDAYQEALWKLLNDDIDDSLQAEAIENLKAGIERLQSGKPGKAAPKANKPRDLN